MKLSWQIVRLNLKETFSIAYGNYTFREALIITLNHSGKKGYGECTAIDYYHINLSDFIKILEVNKSVLENFQIAHPKVFYEFLNSLNLPSFLRSALDCAYWDLFGKLENKSFIEINSIAINKLPQSSITICVDTVLNQIEKIKKSSWKKFKVKCNHFDENEIQKLLELDYDIALDSNGSFTKEQCNWLENNYEISKFSYLEQPMEKGVEQYSNISANKYANWMADEDCQNENELENLKPHYKSINIKLVKCGGLTPALSMIKKARALNYQIMIGCMTESTIGISSGAVLVPLVDYVDLDGANLIANDIATGSFIENGIVKISEKSGLGIELI
jgi:L-Ala-D/L-Glu epimerase